MQADNEERYSRGMKDTGDREFNNNGKKTTFNLMNLSENITKN